MPPPDATIDVLALMAHPDDAELLCAGTLLRAADQGRRTGILDLTGGEAGSYGTPGIRDEEARRAAEILGLAARRSVGLPDGELVNSPEARHAVARHLRELRPRVVILHTDGLRHPDHRVASELGRDACFTAGMHNAPVEGEPYRPPKLLYALTYREADAPRPSFVVDISDQMERKLDAIFAYASQFEGRTALGGVFGGDDRPLRDQIRAHHAHYGSLIRCRFGEPFYTREVLRVDDVMKVGVNSI